MTHTKNDPPALTSVQVIQELRLDQPVDRVWSAITRDVASWWPDSFYVGEAPRRFVIEERVGGRVYEDHGDNQGVLWGQVVRLDRGRLLEWAGDLTAEFGGPARTMVRFELEVQDGDDEDGSTTVLTLRDTTYGQLDEATETSLAQGWKLLLEEHLKPWLEKS